MDTDLDTLCTALYVRVDDELKIRPELARYRPAVGIAPKLSDAELITLSVVQALLGFSSETRFLRFATAHLRHLFPYLPNQSGYNKRLRAAAGQLRALIRTLARSTTLWSDDTSRFFWGLRLHLVTTPAGLPVTFALASPKADEREVLRDLLEIEPGLLDARPGQVILADKGYRSTELERFLADHQATLLRPARADEQPRAGARFLKPLRQVIESVNDTLKGQLDLERHGGRTPAGVIARILQRLLALTAVIWHNDRIGARPHRSLLAYDH